jgi:hypothetical protein
VEVEVSGVSEVVPKRAKQQQCPLPAAMTHPREHNPNVQWEANAFL